MMMEIEIDNSSRWRRGDLERLLGSSVMVVLVALVTAGCHPEVIKPNIDTTYFRRLLFLDLEVTRDGEAAERAADLGLGGALANALCDEIDQNGERYRYQAWKLRVDLDPTPAGVTVLRPSEAENLDTTGELPGPMDLARACGADAAVVGSVTRLEIRRLDPVKLDKVSPSGFALHVGQMSAVMKVTLTIMSAEGGQVISSVEETVSFEAFDEFRPDQGQSPLLPSDDEVLRNLTLSMAKKLGRVFYYSLDR